MLSKISVSTSAFLLISSFAAAQVNMCDKGLKAPAQHPFAILPVEIVAKEIYTRSQQFIAFHRVIHKVFRRL